MSENEHQYVEPSKNFDTRKLPVNELDLTFMTTEPAWGREAPAELQSKLVKLVGQAYLTEDGRTVIDAEPMYGLLAMYTRDLRLGNLAVWNGEVDVCVHWLNLAGDLLRDGYIESFFSALSRVITMLELSQSKGGFLRRRHGTITQEKTGSEGVEPARRGLMGGNKQK